jgi:hypothetical protein
MHGRTFCIFLMSLHPGLPARRFLGAQIHLLAEWVQVVQRGIYIGDASSVVKGCSANKGIYVCADFLTQIEYLCKRRM